MDGNNRWSIKNNRSKYDSYKNGAKKLIEITKFIFDNYDINYVSAFALSKHNFKRGSSIINIIEKVLNDFLTHNLNKNNFPNSPELLNIKDINKPKMMKKRIK